MIPQMTQIDHTESTPTVWYGCYDGGWGNNITPESYSHPAKISRGLAIKIYQYALERKWLKRGDTILDPFGGIGGTCIDAGANGLNWIGVELERRFHSLGQGCDCTGISPAEWLEFREEFRPDTINQLNYKNGRLWCPACIAGALQLAEANLDGPAQPGLFDPAEDSRLPAGFRLDENSTPYSLPHHYTGNLELFQKYAQPGTFAVLLNGDSRYLRQVIGQAVRDGLLSSPPYANGEKGHPSLGSVNKDGWGQDGRDIAGRRGQLANMPLGDAAISSPPLRRQLWRQRRGFPQRNRRRLI